MMHQGMYFQKLKFYRFTPDIFTLSFVDDYFEIFLPNSLMVSMVTPTIMVVLMYLTSDIIELYSPGALQQFCGR